MSHNTRGAFHYLIGAVLVIGTTAIGSLLTSSLTDQQSRWSVLGWATLGIVVTFFYLRGSPQLLVNRGLMLHTALAASADRISPVRTFVS